MHVDIDFIIDTSNIIAESNIANVNILQDVNNIDVSIKSNNIQISTDRPQINVASGANNIEILHYNNNIYFEMSAAGPPGPPGPEGPPGPGTADTVTYDNTTSGLLATNVQDAIDEIEVDFVKKIELSTNGGVLINGGVW